MSRVCFVFIDGIGLGADEPGANPFAALELPGLRALAGGADWTASAPNLVRPDHIFRPLDATLGVDGLPQSGTGQATLFTGVNCAATAGRHWGPFPHSTSKPILAERSLFVRLARAGRRARFANAYPAAFLDRLRASDRWTTTTRMTRDADLPLHTLDDLRDGRALAADITGQGLRAFVPDAPVLTPSEAADRLAAMTAAANLTLFEYFHTDKAGHAQDAEMAARCLNDLDAFLLALAEALDRQGDLLVVSSDHGNL